MKKLLGALALLLFVGLPLAILAAVALAFDDLPNIADSSDPTPDTVARAQVLLRQHDPRAAKDGQLRTVVLTSADIDDLVNYAISRFGSGGVDVRLQPREAIVQVSVPMPRNRFGGYLTFLGDYINISALLGETSGVPLVETLRVGQLPVPSWVANYVIRYAARLLSESEDEALTSDTIRSVTFGDGLLRVEHEWRSDQPDRLKALVISPAEAERLRQYNNRIVDVTDRLERGASLTELLRPVMQLADERSAEGGATDENRAAILAVAFYVNGKGLGAVAPGALDWARPIPRTLRLGGRDDLPKHFMISAAIAATTDTPMSNAVGLYKEVDDSQGGSGFSFTDIAADQAGTRFGQLALQTNESARRLQTRAAAALAEPDILPALDGLADQMPDSEFQRRFGGIGSPAYMKVMQDIERRIADCSLLQ